MVETNKDGETIEDQGELTTTAERPGIGGKLELEANGLMSSIDQPMMMSVDNQVAEAEVQEFGNSIFLESNKDGQEKRDRNYSSNMKENRWKRQQSQTRLTRLSDQQRSPLRMVDNYIKNECITGKRKIMFDDEGVYTEQLEGKYHAEKKPKVEGKSQSQNQNMKGVEASLNWSPAYT